MYLRYMCTHRNYIYNSDNHNDLIIKGKAKRDIKGTWRIINNIFNTKNCKVENTVKKIIHDDVVHEDSGDIANMFNDYFLDIGRNIAQSIGGNNANHLGYMTHINPYYMSHVLI